MDRYTYSPSRREFIAGAVGVGATGLGVGSTAGKSWANQTDASGTVEAVVRFEPAEGAGKAALKRHAQTTQRSFEEFAAGRSDLSIERQFWAANAALVSVDLGSVGRETILGVDDVTAVHPNYGGPVQDAVEEASQAPTEASDTRSQEAGVTYPLTEMDVPQTWDVHDTRGEGVDVAIIDTGINPSGHEELAASLERGGWASFDENGNRLDTEPREGEIQSGHGTAVGGVIAGGTNDDGKRYGIAPEVNLYVAQQVSKPPEGVRLLSVIAGIQWAIEQDVDVLSMSFGNPGYNHAYVEPVQNALDSGIFVVAGLGNSGPATGFSPANIPGVVAAGNINDEREVNSSSSGEHIETERYWGDDAPEEWPDEYTLPDVTAPGTDIPSALPNGEFVSDKSGTSYSSPCIAAVAALAIAATDADNEAIREAMFETARHPAAKDDFDVDPGHDDRHGRGIVSALATISRLRASEMLSGTVTDDSGTPLSGVTVASETGLQTQTDSQGQYELTLPPITQPVGALGVGFETAGTSLNPAETDTQSFELARTDEFDVEMTERMLTHIDPGQTATATFDAANVETLTVELNERGPFDPALELRVNDTPAAVGEPVTIDSDRTQITVSIAVPDETFAARFRPRYEFTGSGTTVGGEGHLVHAHPDPWVVSPSDPPNLQLPVDLMAPRTTLELTDGQGNAVASGDDAAGLVVDKPVTVTAADGATPTVGFANDGAEEPAAVLVAANDVTLSGLVVDAEGAKTGIQVARRAAGPRGFPTPSGVTLRDLTVSGAETAVHTDLAPALRIANNNLTANTTGIRVGHRVPFRDSTTVSGRAKTTVRGNAITDVETGIDVAAQVAAIEGNDLSNIGGTGILVGTPRFLSRHFGQEIGPVRSNTVTGASRGIVVEGVMTRPVEENDLSDIAETALVVEGSVLAPVQANSVENAQRGITVGDEAEVATVSDNEFTNVSEPGDRVETDGETGTGNQDTPSETPTATETPTTPTETETESTATPAATATDGPESDGSGPGLGVGSALAGLGGVGYLLKQRLSDDGADAE